MTPVRIEAVYERIPQGIARDAVRWGFRATIDRESGRTDTAPPDHEPATLALVPLADATEARGTSRALRHAPREAEPSPLPYPDLLGYSSGGWLIPLLPAGVDVAGRGRALDLIA
jgi:hypothetical protein